MFIDADELVYRRLSRELSYYNFIWFVKHFLSPHMSERFVEEDFYEEVFNHVNGNRHNTIWLPRGHGKTEILGIWLTIYIAVCQPINGSRKKEQGVLSRMKSQLIIGVDDRQTQEWFDRIKHFFFVCPFLRRYAAFSKDEKKWNASKIELANGSVIHARSIKGKIRGLHVDRVHCDDIITENIGTLSDRETINIFDAAIDGTTTAKTGFITVTGTPLRFTDILHHLKKNESYATKSMPAIIDWEHQIVLSPNRRTWDDLMATRKRIGSMKFQSEYMLNPIDNETSIIKRCWVEACRSKTFSIQRHRSYFSEVYLGVDFAFSDRITADKSVFLSLGRYDEKWYVLDYISRQGMSGMEQLDLIRQLHAIYKYDMMALEENSIKAIEKDVRAMNLPIKLFRTANIDERDKRNPLDDKVYSISKKNFVMRLATMFENEEIVLPYKTDEDKRKTDDLLNECVSFALEEGKIVEIGVHPDIPIALGYALEIAKSTSFIIDW